MTHSETLNPPDLVAMLRQLNVGVTCRLARLFAGEAMERHTYASVVRPETVTAILSRAQAIDIVVMDMRQKCNYTDYFVLATGNSHRHLERLGSAVLFQLKEEMRRSKIAKLARDLPPEMQGDGSSEWVIIDAGNIFVHLMTEQKRAFLDLQTLWEEQGTAVHSASAILTKDTITVDTTHHSTTESP